MGQEWTKELTKTEVGTHGIPVTISLKDDGSRYVTLRQWSDLIIIDLEDLHDVVNALDRMYDE